MLTNYKAQGSRYAEILLEAGLAEKGCLKNFLAGKAFAEVSTQKLLLKHWIDS